MLTLRIVGTGNETAEASIAFHELAILAVWAGFASFLRTLEFDAINRTSTGTLREFGAGKEFAVFGQFDDHGAATFGTEDVGWSITEVGHLIEFVFTLHFFGKGRVEFFERFFILTVAISDVVQL